MKAIKIDVVTQDVYLVDLDRNLESYYRHLDCELFTAVVHLDQGDTLFIDDEGLLRDDSRLTGGFKFAAYPYQILFGHGLIVGSNQEGEATDVVTTVEKIRSQVRFVSDLDVLRAERDRLMEQPFDFIPL